MALRLVRREPPAPGVVSRTLAQLRQAQREWSATPLGRRVEVARAMRHLIAAGESQLIDTVEVPQRRSASETLAAEVLPLADACRFVEREAHSILGTRRPGSRGRPFWLSGCDARILREPWGLVLILGPSNYPLLLPGVQALQAVVAGNAVAIKPGHGAAKAARAVERLLVTSGAPAGLIAVLDEAVDDGVAAIEAGVDRVVLTGSAATGRAVLARLAPKLTPAVMELSGCDAVFVGVDADIPLAARAIAYGLTLNGSFTCIAPRRVFVDSSRAAELEAMLAEGLATAREVPAGRETVGRVARLAGEALKAGARIVSGERPSGETMRPLVLADVTPEMAVTRADVGAPLLSILRVRDESQALAWAESCDYRLGATVFGEGRAALRLARKIPAGVVVINDMIVPTADPRLPFGGQGASGFGVTRGAEGLLAMTRPKTLIARRGKFRPHFDPPRPDDHALLSTFLQVSHARSPARRLAAAWKMVRLLAARDR